LDVDVELIETEDLGESTVVLVTGADFGEVLDEPRPAEEFEHLLPEETAGVTTTTAPEVTSSSVIGDVPAQLDTSC
jgi:hypothetical protein